MPGWRVAGRAVGRVAGRAVGRVAGRAGSRSGSQLVGQKHDEEEISIAVVHDVNLKAHMYSTDSGPSVFTNFAVR